VEEHEITGSTSKTPTSRRGVTLPEVLLTLRHPNAGVRKDALGELKEVLVNGVEWDGGVAMGRREGEVGKVLGVGGVVRLVADEVGRRDARARLEHVAGRWADPDDGSRIPRTREFAKLSSRFSRGISLYYLP
jgi:hypothetical protein